MTFDIDVKLKAYVLKDKNLKIQESVYEIKIINKKYLL